MPSVLPGAVAPLRDRPEELLLSTTRVDRRTLVRGAAVLVALSVVGLAVAVRLLPEPEGSPDRARSGSLVVGAPVVPGGRPEGVVPPAHTLPTAFRVSSFNVLGHSHTTPGGNKPGWADGRTRMRWQIELLASRGVDVVGFQEFQPPQFEVFTDEVGTEWGVYPGDRLRRVSMHNSIAWRRDTWRVLQRETIPIPYFDGNPVRMPYLRLRHRGTGQEVWFANFHNPASTRGNAQRWRDEATRLEVALVNRLRAETGLPVVVTGDMNEREEYFCAMTRGAPMVAANGGSNGPGGCEPPARMVIDWIFGPSGTWFSGYVADRSRAVRRTTDHAMVLADALLPPRVEVNSCRTSPVPC